MIMDRKKEKDVLLEIEQRRFSAKFPFYVYRIPDHVNVPIHWHSEMEILYTEAYGKVYINNMEYSVEPGDMLFINPGTLHHTHRSTDGEMYHVVFDLNLIKHGDIACSVNDVMDGLIHQNIQIMVNPKQKTEAYQKLLPFVRKLIKYAEHEVSFGMETCMVTSVLFGIFSVLFHENHFLNTDAQSFADVRYVTKMIEHIQHRFASPLTAADLAKLTNLSESYVYRLFREHVGSTPIHYIQSVRIREACRLLSEGKNVSETAGAVGIPNQSYFIKLFREHTGHTPLKWMKRNHKDQSS